MSVFQTAQKKSGVSDTNNEKYNSPIVSKKKNFNLLSNKQFSVYSPTNPLLHLQQTIGNQAVQRLARSGIIQTKLKVSQPDDIYEQEADRVADQVMRMMSSSESYLPIKTLDEKKIDRKCKSCEDEEKEEKMKITRKASSDEGMRNLKVSPNIMNDVDVTLNQGGLPLDTSTRKFMESRFGFDFSKVRIHNDENAAKSANEMNALAYTIGNDIFFGPGQYSPTTERGKKLMAHELVHFLQQDINYNLQTKVIQGSPAYEGKDTDFVDNITLDERPFISHKTSLAIQRQVVVEEPAGGCGICHGPRVAGNIAHRLIQEEFEIISPLGLVEFPFSSPADENGRLDLAVATPEGLEIGEIKPANAQGYVQGVADISFYYAALSGIYPKSNIKPLTLVLPPEVTVFPNYQIPNCPLQMIHVNPPIDGIYGYYCRPSYSQLVRNPNCRCSNRQVSEPVPVPIPARVPETERKREPVVSPGPTPIPVTRSISQEITDFILRVIKSGENAEEAARRFLEEHPEVRYVLIGAAIGVVLATIIEDIGTLGAGILDDPASFSVAFALVRVAQTGR